MKRVLLMFVLFGLMFVSALDESGVESIGEDDAEKIQSAIEDLPIDPETGKVDFEKYAPFRTKADERIDAINLWLEDNASWLKVVFGVVPSISWLFVINLWLWMLFFVMLVLNANVTFGWLPFFGEDKMDLGLFYTSWAQIFGLVVFIIILILKYIASLANIVSGLFDVIWNYVLPMGFAIAVIVIILLIIGCGFSIPLALRIVMVIKIKLEENRKRKAAAKETINREALGKIVEGATGD